MLVRILSTTALLLALLFGVQLPSYVLTENTEVPTEQGVEAADVSTMVRVERVVDGDTVMLRTQDGETQRVRLIGVDAPESVHPTKPVACFGKEAAAALRSLIEGAEVTLVYDASQGEQDKYGRTLGYLFLEDGTLVNEWLIAHGYAYEYTYNKSVPYKYQDIFTRAEDTAAATKQGLWGDGVCM